MGTNITGGYGKETVVSERVDLAGFHLRRAYNNALWLKNNPNPAEPDDFLERSILAVLWSVLALEAGANHIGEDHIATDEYEDFERCRKKFQPPAKVSTVIWKWHWLFKLAAQKEIAPTDPLFSEVERLVKLRHRLSHYAGPDTWSRHYFAPAAPKGDYFLLFNAEDAPVRAEPALIDVFFSAAPPSHYMAARQLLLEWHMATGSDGKELTERFPAL